jgi:TonB-linked SusC/RagA family outer membrane protein
MSIVQVFAKNTYSQNTRLSLTLNNVSVKTVLQQIENRSPFYFIYDATVVDVERKVSLELTDEPLSKILDKLFEETNVIYKIDNRQIVLTAGSLPSVTQQPKSVLGKVTDSGGEPLPGVSVVIKGTTSGNITDINGNYILYNVSPDATLQFSFVGMKVQEVNVAGKAVVNVMMEEETIDLGEVVAVGYLSQRKGLLTGSVASMSVTESLEKIPSTSMGNILAGKLSGVYVSTPNGIPGTAPSITIRTGSSWNDQPVTYVIDGAISSLGDFNNLSPNEIESVTVLKDAAATAVYGSRSAGGVMVVTTKRGMLGKPTFKYSFNTGFDTRTRNASRTSGVQTGELYNRINGDTNPAGWAWSQEELDYIATIDNGWGHDQLETVWNNPSTMSHNLSASGGTERIKYFAGASYVKQNSFLEPLTYDKYNFRLNLTLDITKDLQVFAGMSLNHNKTESSAWWEGDTELYKKLLVWQPDQPVFTESGKPIDYGWYANIGASLNKDNSGYSRKNYLKPRINLSAVYKIPFIQGLSAKIAFDQHFADEYQKNFEKNYDMYVMKKDGINRHIIHTDDASIVGTRRSNAFNYKDNLYARNTRSQGYQLNFQCIYDRMFDLHHVQGTFVYETTYSKGTGFDARRETFPVYTTDQWWATSSTRANSIVGGDTDWEDGRISYIGQFNYDYDGKYLASFSFREDGSMKFAPDERWGFFPAGSVGWVISKEPFFADTGNISNLKIRASVGLTGNDAVGGWQWQESYRSGTSAYFGENPSRYSGITYGSVVNPGLTWEKALTYNVGFDVNYFKNWSTSAEYWFRKSYDILGSRNAIMPTTFSLTMPSENYGQINAQGFDFSLGYRNPAGALDYYANLTMSYGWNKVIKKDYAENAKEIDIPVGKSTNYIIGYDFDRIIRTQEELDAFNAANPNYSHSGYKAVLGRMVYQDRSGPDREPDGMIDSWDQIVLKKNNFPIVYGLNLGATWKGFSLDLMFNGKLKQVKSFRGLAGNVEWNRMWREWYHNSWTPENTNAWLPKAFSANDGAKGTYNTTSAFWLKDASFVRLKYLNLSYTIPKHLYNQVVNRINLYFSGTNLFCLSSFNYYDPEIDGGFDFPIMRSFNFGIDIMFK